MSEREALRRALLDEEPPTDSGVPFDPPSDEELLDYLDGKLSPDAETRLQALLVGHPELARRLLDLEALAQATRQEVEPAADFATAAGWREIRSRLRRETAPTPSGSPWLRIAASVLLVSTLTLALQVWRLQHRTPPAEMNFATLELVSARGAAADVPEVETAPGQRFRLVLHPAETCPRYRAEIAGGGKPVVLEGLERDPLGRLNVFLALPPGEYSFRLSGCDPPRTLEEIPFRVRSAGGR